MEAFDTNAALPAAVPTTRPIPEWLQIWSCSGHLQHLLSYLQQLPSVSDKVQLPIHASRFQTA